MVPVEYVSRLGIYDLLLKLHHPPATLRTDQAPARAQQGQFTPSPKATFSPFPTPIPELPGLGFLFPGSQAVQLVL